MSKYTDSRGRVLPQVWAHRGASLEYPENSLASFRAAIDEGSEGIESDIHTTSDGKILMFHDPSLGRTTNGTGEIKALPWEGVIEHVRTRKAPHQPIPLFEELVALLMAPNALHVRLNIDLKPNNDAEQVFPVLKQIISTVPDWPTVLAPRIVLGLWHPKFIKPAQRYLPELTVHHITASLSLSESHFWDSVSGFSVAFPLLLGPDGERFRERCRVEGKEWGCWTVNQVDAMCVANDMGAGWVLTDTPAVARQLREELVSDFDGTYAKHVGKWFGWALDWRYWIPASTLDKLLRRRLTKAAGPILPPETALSSPPSTEPRLERRLDTTDRS